MSEEPRAQNGGPQSPAVDVSADENATLTEQERERIRREELRSFQERRYHEEVRRELRGAALWDRMLRVLKLESGVFAEIASDAQATRQAVIVIALAYGLCFLKTGPLLLLSVPVAVVAIAISTGNCLLRCPALRGGTAAIRAAVSSARLRLPFRPPWASFRCLGTLSPSST